MGLIQLFKPECRSLSWIRLRKKKGSNIPNIGKSTFLMLSSMQLLQAHTTMQTQGCIDLHWSSQCHGDLMAARRLCSLGASTSSCQHAAWSSIACQSLRHARRSRRCIAAAAAAATDRGVSPPNVQLPAGSGLGGIYPRENTRVKLLLSFCAYPLILCLNSCHSGFTNWVNASQPPKWLWRTVAALLMGGQALARILKGSSLHHRRCQPL